MRELKDYFCTVIQTNALIKLGYVQKDHIGYIKPDGEVYCRPVFFADSKSAILRSQALDFFRDKGWEFAIKCLNKMYWYEIYIGDSISFDENITEDGLYDYHVSESALIDKLIELLETEAQHGE